MQCVFKSISGLCDKNIEIIIGILIPIIISIFFHDSLFCIVHFFTVVVFFIIVVFYYEG